MFPTYYEITELTFETHWRAGLLTVKAASTPDGGCTITLCHLLKAHVSPDDLRQLAAECLLMKQQRRYMGRVGVKFEIRRILY